MQTTPLSTVSFAGWELALKLEGHCPNNSHKSRAAVHAVGRLRRAGFIRGSFATKKTLVISSSGNAANEVAKLTINTNVELVVFTDTLSPAEMIERLQGWPHVRVEIINDPDETGSHAKARRRAVKAFLAEHTDAIEVDQYSDSDWPCGYFSLFHEIEQQVKRIGAILIPVGTVATLRAAAQFKIRFRCSWKIFAVDAAGSALNGVPNGRRLFSGYGNGGQTEWARQVKPYVAEWLCVPDNVVVRASRWLCSRGFFLGASSAAVFAAASNLIARDRLPHDGTAVLVCSDHGSLYRSTLYSDEFLLRNQLDNLLVATSV
jgi:cystathionine beta-synthase